MLSAHRTSYAAILLFLLTRLIPGQAIKPADEQKNAEIAERRSAVVTQLASDADGLGLAENRAMVFARVGTLLWKQDQKQAEAYFQRSVDELVGAQSQAESEARNRANRSSYEFRVSQVIRSSVLLAIATNDAKFALESLYRTRTGPIQRALTQFADPTPKIADLANVGAMTIRSELNLEQRITRLAAEQDPAIAVRLLTESLKRGISSETLSLLKKLFEKDPDSANSFASDVLDQLNSSDLSNSSGNTDNLSLTLSILSDFIRDKKPDAKEIKFGDMQIRSLAGKLIAFTLSQDPRSAAGRIAAVIKIAQKLAPSSVAALKRLQKNGIPSGSANADPDVRKIIDSKATPAQMVNDAKSLVPADRAPVYQAAANRMAQYGDFNGASGLLNQYFSGTALENALAAANMAYANYLIGKQKYAEAEDAIDDLPYDSKRLMLLNLASSAFRTEPVENRTLAVGVLRKVRSMMPDRPSNSYELVQFMQFAATYAPIDSDESFNCLEPLVPQLNELADANAVVQGFQDGGSVHLGEFVIGSSTYGFQLDLGTIRALAKADLDRTQKLIDLFTRREIRADLRLRLAESGLK